jgi:hypothetical protein
LVHLVARTGLDPWDAHVAAIAGVEVCPILALNAAKWQRPSVDLDEPPHIIEIVDPGDQEPGTQRRCWPWAGSFINRTSADRCRQKRRVSARLLRTSG